MTNVTDNKQISVGTRLGTMLLDHFIMTMIAMVFFIPGMISGFSGAYKVSHEQTTPDFMGGTLGYIGMFGFALYFCKDTFNGRSIAKRILKLQIVDNTTGQVAGPLKCFVRNILCVLWPIEVIVAITNPNRRLGDRIAGTQLIKFDPALEQPEINIGKTLLSIGISYGLILLLLQAIPKMEMSKINYIETSYNQTESKELKKLLTDSLGQYLTADIRVYDTIKNENLKYISAILKLKETLFEDDNSYSQLNYVTTSLIYSKFPKETFTGKLKFIYQTSGQFQSRSTIIGTYIKPRDRQ
jgi:uncharacterized RDD family membrane protein YckC